MQLANSIMSIPLQDNLHRVFCSDSNRPKGGIRIRSRTQLTVQQAFLTDVIRRVQVGQKYEDWLTGLEDGEVVSAKKLKNVFGYPRNLQSNYELGPVVGVGSWGVVKVGTNLDTGEQVAIKEIEKQHPKSLETTADYLKKLQNEVDMLQQMSASLNAVHLLDTYEDDANIYLVMELCEGGGLLDRLKEGSYSEAYIAQQIRSVMQLMAQCHSKEIMYRDVKASNFLFLNNEELSPLKALDFGLAIRHRANDPPLESRTGTPVYMAPEVIQRNYSYKSDVWSVGILAYQLLTGKFPWPRFAKRPKEIFTSIIVTDIDYDRLSKTISREGVDFLKCVLNRDIDARLSAKDALQHPWLQPAQAEVSLPNLPLNATVVQRLQRFATYNHLKQMVLRKMVDEVQEHVHNVQKMRLIIKELLNETQKDLAKVEDVQERLQEAGYEVTVPEVACFAGKFAPDLVQDTNVQVPHPSQCSACSLSPCIAYVSNTMDKLRLLFKELDTDKNGEIDRIELTTGLQRLGYSITLEEATRIFDQFDVDNSGHIDFEEMATVMLDWADIQEISGEWSEWVDRVFHKIDQDRDGYLSFKELLDELPCESNCDNCKRDAQRLIRQVDLDNDGRVSLEEFRTLMIFDDKVPDLLDYYDPRLPIFQSVDE